MPVEQQVTELKARLDEAEREAGQFKALLQRAQADFANYRKRADSERDEQQKYANGRLLLKLVAVVDDLARALEHAPAESTEAGRAWVEGVRLFHKNLAAILESEGVSSIQAVGRPFDPSAHEAVLLQESADAPDGTVLAVARAGYRLHERILRSAQVVVSRRPQSQQPSTTQESQKENSNG
jgi:molecular chaperone GrpE